MGGLLCLICDNYIIGGERGQEGCSGEGKKEKNGKENGEKRN